MSEPPADPPMSFEAIVTCDNPMEAEIFPAALREAEIPHRTVWEEGGSLTILVASEWREEARAALDRAARVFFGQTETPSSDVQAGGGEDARAPGPAHQPAGAKPEPAEEAGEGDDPDDGGGLFMGDALPTPDETRIRPVWPAWVLAAIPGLGLGHLYAGKVQMFFYLLFCSLLAVMFHQFTGSIWSFSLVVFAWAVDLGFAAYQVKDANRRALRARKRLAKAEQDFLESL